MGLGRRGERRYSCSFGTRGLSHRRDSLGFLLDDEPDSGVDPALDTPTPYIILALVSNEE